MASLKKKIKKVGKKVRKAVKKPIKKLGKAIKKNPVISAIAGVVFIPVAGAQIAKAVKSGGKVIKSATNIGQVVIPSPDKTKTTAEVFITEAGKVIAATKDKTIAEGNAIEMPDGTVNSVKGLGITGTKSALASGGTIIDTETTPTTTETKPFVITPAMVLIGGGTLLTLILLLTKKE